MSYKVGIFSRKKGEIQMKKEYGSLVVTTEWKWEPYGLTPETCHLVGCGGW